MPWQKLASDGVPLGPAPRFSMGVSNLGNTLSESRSSTGATVTLAGDGYVGRYWANSADVYSSSSANMALGSMSFGRIELPYQVSFTEVAIPVIVSLATSAVDATAALNLSAIAVLYSRVTGAGGGYLKPFLGISSTTTYTWDSNSGVYSSLTGPRLLSFNLQTTLSAGEYYLGLYMSSASTSSTGTATTALSATLGIVYGVVPNVVFGDLPGITVQNSDTVLNIIGLRGQTTLTQTSYLFQVTQLSGIQASPLILLRGY